MKLRAHVMKYISGQLLFCQGIPIDQIVNVEAIPINAQSASLMPPSEVMRQHYYFSVLSTLNEDGMWKEIDVEHLHRSVLQLW